MHRDHLRIIRFLVKVVATGSGTGAVRLDPTTLTQRYRLLPHNPCLFYSSFIKCMTSYWKCNFPMNPHVCLLIFHKLYYAVEIYKFGHLRECRFNS